jgi:hypothetical protein
MSVDQSRIWEQIAEVMPDLGSPVAIVAIDPRTRQARVLQRFGGTIDGQAIGGERPMELPTASDREQLVQVVRDEDQQVVAETQTKATAKGYSVRAAASPYRCRNGHLYYCVMQGGSEICWDTGLTC